MAYSSTPLVHASAVGAQGATTPARDTTGADLIVLVVPYYNATGDPPLVSDSYGNAWGFPISVRIGGICTTQIWCCQAPIVGAGHTFHVAAFDMFGSIMMSAWSGSVASPFDQENGAAGASVSVLSTGSVTPTETNELLITGICFNANSGGAVSIDSGFTIMDTEAFAFGVNIGGSHAYLVRGSAASANPQWDLTNSSADIAAAIVTFKDTPGGGGFVATRLPLLGVG